MNLTSLLEEFEPLTEDEVLTAIDQLPAFQGRVSAEMTQRFIADWLRFHEAARKPRLGVGVIVVDFDGRVLLGRRGKEPGFGKLVIPGGGVLFGERLVEAALREVKEEAGIEPKMLPDPIVRIPSQIIEDDVHKVVLIMKGHYTGPDEPTGCEEFQEPRFYYGHELKKLLDDLWWPTSLLLNDLGYLR